MASGKPLPPSESQLPHLRSERLQMQVPLGAREVGEAGREVMLRLSQLGPLGASPPSLTTRAWVSRASDFSRETRLWICFFNVKILSRALLPF